MAYFTLPLNSQRQLATRVPESRTKAKIMLHADDFQVMLRIVVSTNNQDKVSEAETFSGCKTGCFLQASTKLTTMAALGYTHREHLLFSGRLRDMLHIKILSLAFLAAKSSLCIVSAPHPPGWLNQFEANRLLNFYYWWGSPRLRDKLVLGGQAFCCRFYQLCITLNGKFAPTQKLEELVHFCYAGSPGPGFLSRSQCYDWWLPGTAETSNSMPVLPAPEPVLACMRSEAWLLCLHNYSHQNSHLPFFKEHICSCGFRLWDA